MRRILPFVLLGIVACSESPAEVSMDVAPSFAKGGVLASVTGSGHITTSANRTFTFSAQQKSDGTVSGQFNLVIHGDPQTKIHAEVVCMSVDGNRAWVGGVVKSASNPDWVGLETAWAVEDNGQGSPSPDLISLMYVPFAGAAQPNCDDKLQTPSLPVEGGNVSVR